MHQVAKTVDVAAIDEVLCRLGATVLPLRHLEPQNGEEEKKKFLSSDSGDPSFRYAPLAEESYASISRELDAIEFPKSPTGALLERTAAYIRAHLRLRKNIGTADFTDTELYGHPPANLVEIAKGMLKLGQKKDGDGDNLYEAEVVATLMRRQLAEYGLNDWQVVVRRNISATNVEAGNKMVLVKGDKRYSLASAKRLVVHEIDTHVLRAANGFLQPLRIFGAALIPGYLATEEGLAMVNEERTGLLEPRRMRGVAARVIAADLAIHKGFREVYQALRDFEIDTEEAWTTTMRVKRGLSNTREPGGFIKDHVYLWGKLKVEEYVVEGGDLTALYVGKVGLDHLSIVSQMGINPPRYLPNSYAR